MYFVRANLQYDLTECSSYRIPLKNPSKSKALFIGKSLLTLLGLITCRRAQPEEVLPRDNHVMWRWTLLICEWWTAARSKLGERCYPFLETSLPWVGGYKFIHRTRERTKIFLRCGRRPYQDRHSMLLVGLTCRGDHWCSSSKQTYRVKLLPLSIKGVTWPCQQRKQSNRLFDWF